MAKIEGLIEGYTLIAKPSTKGEKPPHLQPYQEKFAEVAREAAEETKHLKGEKRVRRMNDLISQKLKVPES